MRLQVFRFDGIARASVCSIDFNPFDEGGIFGEDEDDDSLGTLTGAVFDPGGHFLPGGASTADKQADAKNAAAELEWRNVLGNIPTYDQMTLDYGYGGDVIPYSYGQPIDPSMLSYADRGDSEWFGANSALEGIGPSAYSEMGPSAYSGLGFDTSAQRGMKGSEDYFADLMTDPTDAVAEAEYARRQQEAEQARRSQTGAALAEQEMRGQGGAGANLLAELSGAQGMTSDLYSAGMDANAIAQDRRDAAAASRADLAEKRGRAKLDADEARATGLDKFAGERASGLDKYGIDWASGMDDFAGKRANAMDDWSGNEWDDWYKVQEGNTQAQNAAKYDWAQRWRNVSDKNADKQTDTARWNKVEAPQQQFNNLVTGTSGMTGQLQYGAGAAQDRADAGRQREEERKSDREQTAANIFTYGASNWGGDDDEEEDK